VGRARQPHPAERAAAGLRRESVYLELAGGFEGDPVAHGAVFVRWRLGVDLLGRCIGTVGLLAPWRRWRPDRLPGGSPHDELRRLGARPARQVLQQGLSPLVQQPGERLLSEPEDEGISQDLPLSVEDRQSRNEPPWMATSARIAVKAPNGTFRAASATGTS